MHRAVANLIAVVERSEHGFADVPPGSLNDHRLKGGGFTVGGLNRRLKVKRLKVGGLNHAATKVVAFGEAESPVLKINDELESQLAELGYAVALSDRMWLGGYRVHSPESIQAGNYRPHVPTSNFTCIASRSAHVPDARDFDLEAVLEERGELRTN
jgi:hypothetical protein